jgi:hypothetical protein
MHWAGIEPEASKQEVGGNSPSTTREDYNAVLIVREHFQTFTVQYMRLTLSVILNRKLE